MNENKVRYTCPMHSEVVSDVPGDCPKCGMSLEEEKVGGKSAKAEKKGLDHQKFHSHPGHHEEMDPMEHHWMMAEDFKKRFLVVLPLTIIVLILSPKIQEWFYFSIKFNLQDFVLFILGNFIVWYGGLPFFQAAKAELKTKNYGMMTLVSLAVLSGYFFSFIATFLFPEDALWWEISTLVLVFLFGHWMEMRAVIGTGGALKELAKLIPPTAHKLKGKQVEDVPTEKLVRGDLVLVKPGEKIPADGIVVDGVSLVDEAMITGESKPQEKKKGSEVIGGTINIDGSLTVKITKTGKESALSQIMDLITQAQNTKPSVQKLADKAANILTLIAVVVSIGTFLYWSVFNPQGIVFALTLAITVIVIACPHALGLAIPTVTTISTSLAARNGILIRDMKGLEVAKNLDYIVLDKTGTLTEGKFGVAKIIENKRLKIKSDEILKMAASVEIHSQHSIGQGIVEEARLRRLEFEPAKNFKSYPGKGATAVVNGDLLAVGNKKMLQEMKILDSGLEIPDKTYGTLVYVARRREILGAIILEDKIRPESKRAVEEFHRMGIKVAMLTGDRKEVAQKVGKELGIDTIFAEVLPQDKVRKVRELQGKGYIVGMVGDGVNDAPSLTQAHVGIAIGAGTSVAIESAEIVLVKSNPLDIVKVIKLSRKVDAKIKQNLLWATGYNVLAIPAAAGVFYPWRITLRPEWAALAMSASSIIVVANALLLRRTEL